MDDCQRTAFASIVTLSKSLQNSSKDWRLPCVYMIKMQYLCGEHKYYAFNIAVANSGLVAPKHLAASGQRGTLAGQCFIHRDAEIVGVAGGGDIAAAAGVQDERLRTCRRAARVPGFGGENRVLAGGSLPVAAYLEAVRARVESMVDHESVAAGRQFAIVVLSEHGPAFVQQLGGPVRRSPAPQDHIRAVRQLQLVGARLVGRGNETADIAAQRQLIGITRVGGIGRSPDSQDIFPGCRAVPDDSYVVDPRCSRSRVRRMSNASALGSSTLRPTLIMVFPSLS